MRRSAKDQRGRPPPTVRGELIESQIAVGERLLDTVGHHSRPQSGDPGLDRGAAVRERDRRGRPLGESEPPLGICRAACQGSDPGCLNGECGIPPQVVIAEPAQPLLHGLHPAVVVQRQSKAVDQARYGIRLTRGVPVDDRGFRQVVGDAPGHRPTVELGHDVRLAALELLAQQLAEQVVVAIPLASPVEGYHEAVPALERLERVCRPRRLQHGVAETATHAIEHRGVLEKLRLGRRQPGQQLEAEVLGHEPVVAAEARGARRARRPGLHRQRREVQARGPTFRPLGQLGKRVRVRARLRQLQAAAWPPARPAGGPARRSRAPDRAPASGQAAVPGLPCSRPRSASRPERTRTALRARPDRTGWRRRGDRRAPAPAGAQAPPARSRRVGRGWTRWIPLDPTTPRTPRPGPARRRESRPRCIAGTPPRRRLGRRARPTRTDADQPRPTSRAASSCRTRRARPRSRKATSTRTDGRSRPPSPRCPAGPTARRA